MNTYIHKFFTYMLAHTYIFAHTYLHNIPLYIFIPLQIQIFPIITISICDEQSYALYVSNIIFLYIFLNCVIFGFCLRSSHKWFHSLTPETDTEKLLVVRLVKIFKLYSPLRLHPPSQFLNKYWIFSGNCLLFALYIVIALWCDTISISCSKFDSLRSVCSK